MSREPETFRRSRLHLRFGWWALLAFLTLGLALEALHGFKVQSYLGVESSTRRLMWTLAHAHGTLLALVHLAFAWTLERLAGWPAAALRLASRCLLGAGVLMPAGFFLAGFGTRGGDPGLAIVLAAAGGLLLLLAVLLTARQASAGPAETAAEPPSAEPSAGKSRRKKG